MSLKKTNNYKAEYPNDDEEEEEEEDEDYNEHSELLDADPDEEDDEQEDDSSSQNPDSHVILDGTLSFSEDGRLMYSGIWYMNHEAPQTDDDDDDEKGGGNQKNAPSSSERANTFQWTSQDCYQHPSSTALENGNANKKTDDDLWMDLNHPLLLQSAAAAAAAAGDAVSKDTQRNSRKIAFSNGYFETSSSADSSSEILETDLELTLSLQNNNNISHHHELSFQVLGTGKNEYGPFTLQGEYIPRRKYCKQFSLICHKMYDGNGTHKRKYIPQDEDEGEEEEDVSVDEENAYEELLDLYEDAKLSLQELTQRYSSNGGGGRRGDAMKRSKRNPEEEEEDVDRGCGF